MSDIYGGGGCLFVVVVGQMFHLAAAVFRFNMVTRKIYYSNHEKFVNSDFAFQMETVDLTVLHIMSGILTSASTLFLYCHFGVMASDSFSKYADCLYKMPWYELPINYQKYYLLMIQNSQMTLGFNGLGLVPINLETYTKVFDIQFSFSK